MKEIDIAETAFKNGYEKGVKDTAREIVDWIRSIRHIGSLRSELDLIESHYGIDKEDGR